MALTSSLSVAASAELTSAADLATGAVPLTVRHAVSLASGTGVGKADKVFHDRRTLAASATEDLDLAGVLLDSFGAAITFARVKGLVVTAAAGNVNNVVIGAAAANPWTALLGATGTLIVRPGGFVCVGAGAADVGYAVTAGSGDVLRVANSGAGSSVTYDIVIIGASA
ncbi:hypothetical protein [Streptomyces wuyuanensis]|uniref:Uncharacterized protein n=1 Tax=Streptomyces wuyuanensis TaxID=1196353 RepID=A0A1G9VZK8_9ACTN|nr:hypothetical protein [Streptomyces wuyuanensis]SDM77326.1 hypothetical protein SAMN05444921_11353 [Streptomyces wuyuanensis]